LYAIETAIASAPPAEHGDILVADRFVHEHGADFRFVHGLGWHRWAGYAWLPCKLGEHIEAVKAVTRAMVGAADVDAPEAKSAMKASRVVGALKLAESDPVVALAAGQLDRDPYILATPDGIVDLRTGLLRAATREDLVSLVTAVGPAERVGPLFTGFIERVQPDAERRALVQRVSGLGATGLVENALPLNLGIGANGKSVFKECVTVALGDYAHVAPLDLLLASRRDAGRASPELAGLRGRRWVEVSESPEGGVLSVERVKWITGGDQITARVLYQNPITFTPTHTVSLFSNHAPRVMDDGLAIWRRIIRITWSVIIPDAEQDSELAAKIAAEELGGVLRWIITGAVAYLRDGLAVPESVLRDTEAYRAGEDFFGCWIAECTEANPHAKAQAGALMASYRGWAVERDGPKLRDVELGERLAQRGFTRSESGRRVYWDGLRILEVHP